MDAFSRNANAQRQLGESELQERQNNHAGNHSRAQRMIPIQPDVHSCTDCGAHFIPKCPDHDLCLCCWLWRHVGRSIRTNLRMIRKARDA